MKVNQSIEARKIFSQFATGICILLTENIDNQCKGLTINSFSSLSLEPLLVIFSLKTASAFYKNFDMSKNFSINILSKDKKSLADRYSISGGAVLSNSEIEKKMIVMSRVV